MPQFKAKSGIEWFYDIEGDGEPLIFIHGWGMDRRIWRQQLKYFVQGYKTLSIDLPGHGKSSWGDISFSDMATDIHQIFEYEKLNHVTLVGSSLGGLFALKYFSEFPEKIKRMIFVGSLPKFSKSDDYPHGFDLNEMKKLDMHVDDAYPAIIDIFFRSLFTKQERATRRYKWMQKFKSFDVKPVQMALKSYLHILEHADLRENLKEVNVPMQFINGAEDHICSRETVYFLKEITHTETRFDLFHQCGHFPFLSRAYEFNDIMEAFLKQTS